MKIHFKKTTIEHTSFLGTPFLKTARLIRKNYLNIQKKKYKKYFSYHS